MSPQLLDLKVARLVPFQFAKTKGVIAARRAGDRVVVWAREDVQPAALSELRRVLGAPIEIGMVEPERFEHYLSEVYGGSDGPAAALMEGIEQEFDLQQLVQEVHEVADLLETEGEAPIIRLLNGLLTQALRENASDIHIEAFESRSVVRFRIDGTLRDVLEPRRDLHAAIVSRIKVMAQLDIAEKRLPQDGRIALRLAGRPVDVRVSTLHTGHGERVVLRLLDKQAGRLELRALGLSAETLTAVDALLQQPHGIVLVTGPTGSGKTTTLYAALGRLDAKVRNIMTVEDPIEYDLDGIGQTQINPRIDMTFARALRAILRQDPDVIMIGEIRDVETAQIAVQASLTGHLVLATLHTNDSVSAVTRLTEMGVEPYLLSSSLLAVLAQRLVRMLCLDCRRAHPPDPEELAALAVPAVPDVVHSADGCPHCGYTGFHGRTGIYELLQIDQTLRGMINERAPEQALRDYAASRNMVNLRQDGMRWVATGKTSLEEVLRVTRAD